MQSKVLRLSLQAFAPALDCSSLGDSFYEGPIYLFSRGTDLEAYRTSMERVSTLALRTSRSSWRNPGVTEDR